MKAQYSIRDIEKLTGIKAHTLRIWEQRYDLVVPFRTDTNIRYYDDEQLKLLINISLMLKNGKKISKVSGMSAEAISKEVVRMSMDAPDTESYFTIQVDSLIISMVDMDEERFEKVFSVCVLRYGFEKTMTDVITPFLGKVGVLWSIGEVNVAQEHFISNLVRQKLVVAIDGLISKRKNETKYLLFLPEGEYHELGLLFAEYIIKSRGNQIIYLGQSLPYSDLVKLCTRYQPDYILTYFTSGIQKISIQEYLETMRNDVACKQILICGPKAKEAVHGKLPETVLFIETVEALVDQVNKNTAV